MLAVMVVVLPTMGSRIAPVLDAATRFVLVSPGAGGALSRMEVVVSEQDPVAKARRIVGLGAKVLICGAISWTIEALLISAGMRVIANTCGPTDVVAAAYFAGGLTETAFLLPGCPGRQHRHRHRHRRGRRWRNGW
jgi:predicted Fe-Mo cluster-binding NifX family protein